MTGQPEVSVVMAVYNAETRIRDSVESILGQENVELELIVVDDGSTDGSRSILDGYSVSDPRVRVIHQEHRGLTWALIQGCASTRGRLIARQDAGDISLPGRLAMQLACITRHPDASLVSCGTRFVGPNREFLYEVVRDPSKIEGPSSHPSTMFTKSLYDKVNGYRSAFYFAQDLDLWARLAEHGPHVPMPEVLYEASFGVATISGTYRREQIATTKLILECARKRRLGQSELPVLERARRIGPSNRGRPGRIAKANALYFVGACLSRTNKRAASNYFKQAVCTNPLHLKSAIRLVIG